MISKSKLGLCPFIFGTVGNFMVCLVLVVLGYTTRKQPEDSCPNLPFNVKQLWGVREKGIQASISRLTCFLFSKQ